MTGHRNAREAAKQPIASTLAPFLLVMIGAATYANSLRGVFLFDDYKHIVENEAIRDLASPGHYLADRRPVTQATFAINHAVSGLEPWSYHIGNIVIHLAAALTLYGIVRRTVRIVGDRDACDRETDWLALVIALIWLVHPLQTQSVTYLIQRGESLMGLFYLLCLYAVIRAAAGKRVWAWSVAAAAACAAGMASKAVMITAPVVVMIYDRMFLAPSWSALLRQRGLLYLMLTATSGVLWLCGIAQAVLLTEADPDMNVGFAYTGISPTAYALTQPKVILYYLRLALWPDVLCLDYQWQAVASLSEAAVWLITVVVFVAATIVGVIARHWLGFAGVWFFVILLPTSSIVPIKDVIFEHRMYLPLAAVVSVVVAGAYAAVRRLFRLGPFDKVRPAHAYALLVPAVVLPLCFRTVRRNRDYASAASMWQSVLSARPASDRAHLGLGAAHFRAGRYEEAVACFLEAIRLTPRYADAHYNLGAVAAALDDWPAAIDAYRRAVSLAPRRTRYGLALGEALGYVGRFDDAAGAYRDVLRVEPESSKAAAGLAHALADAGHYAEAVAAFDRALALTPNSIELIVNSGIALRRTGRINEAIKRYRRAVELDGRSAAAHANLGAALAQLGEYAEAAPALERAIALDPSSLPPYRALQAVYTRLGRPDRAHDVVLRVLARDPSNHWARKTLERLSAPANQEEDGGA